ncbi:MAG: tetratricopeptide repeat protein [Schaedlerella sp.]|nr:tetratricopeptide repeat protein [Schaedlerella sp.]
MDYTKKIHIQSGYWYNDGLKKAQMKDISGAIVSLRKSLQFDKENIQARNLLGLMYYGRGEVAEALVEWIISKNLKPKDNPANRYLQKIQETPQNLETINQAVKKYNQSLAYCEQQSEDLAIIQLKRAIAEHPTFLKAYQLLALLYIHTGQQVKAKQLLRKAKKLDTTNEITLCYIHALNQEDAKQEKKEKEPKKKKRASVEYNLGNETIIQPVHSAVREMAGRSVALCIIIGLLAGAALVGFLFAPASEARIIARHNKEVLEYSEKINMQEAQISALQRTLDKYRDASQGEDVQTVSSTMDSYEALLDAYSSYTADEFVYGYGADDILSLLYNVSRDSLGSGGQVIYDSMMVEVAEEGSELLYQSALEYVEVGNYSAAISALEVVVWYDESYENGNALLNLGVSYMLSGETEKATASLAKVKELFPDTEMEEKANDYLKEMAGESGEDTTE